MNRQASIVYYHDKLYGVLVKENEHKRMGGQPFANAFKRHHVQLVRTRGGQYRLVDDMDSDAFQVVDGVLINERPRRGRGQIGAPWAFTRDGAKRVREEINVRVFG